MQAAMEKHVPAPLRQAVNRFGNPGHESGEADANAGLHLLLVTREEAIPCAGKRCSKQNLSCQLLSGATTSNANDSDVTWRSKIQTRSTLQVVCEPAEKDSQ